MLSIGLAVRAASTSFRGIDMTNLSFHATSNGKRVAKWLATVIDAQHLKRTGMVALLVGSWLTAVNQGDVLAGGEWNAALLVKIVLNYLTPFVVANIGLLSRHD